MALQTREQHIRRQRATSNICTAQVLPAVLASMYAVYHGGLGLKKIADGIRHKALVLAEALRPLVRLRETTFFNTLCVEGLSARAYGRIKVALEASGINLFYAQGRSLRIAVDETHASEDLQAVVDAFCRAFGRASIPCVEPAKEDLPSSLKRTSPYLQQPSFNRYQTEHEMLRYMKRLENKDISLTNSMIPLGSCTMKLNATAEMIPLSWRSFSHLHPFVPSAQSKGYRRLMDELGAWLQEITGMSGISFQPNSGAQGEYAGLLVIRRYLAFLGKNSEILF